MKISQSLFLAYLDCPNHCKELISQREGNNTKPNKTRVILNDERLFYNLTRDFILSQFDGSSIEWDLSAENDTVRVSSNCIIKTSESISILIDYRPITHIKKDWIAKLFFQMKMWDHYFNKKINSVYAITIEKEFESGKKFGILRIQSLNKKIEKESPFLESKYNDFLNFIQNPKYSDPKNDDETCQSPKSCHHRNVCFPIALDTEVFSLRDSQHFAMSLYRRGLGKWENIPIRELSSKQEIQVLAHRENRLKLNLTKLLEYSNIWTNESKETISFLDFETVNPCFPMFERTKPFDHIPILFSLHIYDGNALTHHLSQLHWLDKDPRLDVLTELKSLLPKNGPIFAFQSLFEEGVLKSSSEAYPEFWEDWLLWKERMLDMATPFRQMWVYHPRQNGSFSLKEILPALVPEKSYKGLEIKNGAIANRMFLQACESNDPHLKEKTAKDIQEYCSLDTLSLFLIYKFINAQILSQNSL